MSIILLEIDIAGPFVTSGVVASAFGIDTSVLRDHAGRMVLPGTLVKGVISDVLDEMATAAPGKLSSETVRKWLGTETQNADTEHAGSRYSPLRAQVRFRDLYPKEAPTARRSMTRIAIDDQRGSVKHGFLQVIETPVALGEAVTFAGEIDVDPHLNAKDVRYWIERALALVPALGGIKSAGFGRVLSVRLSDPAPASSTATNAKLKSDSAALQRDDVVRYALMFAAPFLVGSETVGGNLFRGSTIVPGGAVKGALADELERTGKLGALAGALDKVVVRHAKPVKIGGNELAARPRVVPLSLYSIEKATSTEVRFKDALAAGAEPDSEAAKGNYVTFPPDWKSSDHVGELFKLYGHTYEARYDIRTRTAIDDDGVAESAKLFSSLAVVPGDHVWVGEIARGSADEKSFKEIIAALAQGLSSIGKTEARAAVAILPPAQSRSAAPIATQDGKRRWRIILETDALMHGPGALDAHSSEDDPAARLRLQYRDYFAQALGVDADALASLRFYASQRWAGGYQALRYPHHDAFYYPQLVTQAGSVFELQFADGIDVTAAIQRLVHTGLPLPSDVPRRSLEHERSAFVPQNGYGEVSIDARDLVTGRG